MYTSCGGGGGDGDCIHVPEWNEYYMRLILVVYSMGTTTTKKKPHKERRTRIRGKSRATFDQSRADFHLLERPIDHTMAQH